VRTTLDGLGEALMAATAAALDCPARLAIFLRKKPRSIRTAGDTECLGSRMIFA
jgi:hypothetical protein